MFTWMSARPVHIAKYITQYQTLFPASRILLIQNRYEDNWIPGLARRMHQPAVRVVMGLAESTPKSTTAPQMLVHIFSNGGLSSAAAFQMIYKSQSPTGLANLPRYVTVLDSCPGLFAWASSYRAFSAPLPRYLKPLAYVLVVLGWIWVGLLRRPEPWDVNAAKTVAPELREKELRRTYIYSSEDDVIDWRHVEGDAERAKELGFVVNTERFIGSRHVAHAKEDPVRYWGIVKTTWNGSAT